MFGRLSSPAQLEEEVLAFWDTRRIFARVLEQGAGRPPFVFYEGPPTANGTPHNGHVLTRVMKDVFPRYKTMRGFHVDRKAGWDTHGLPVEVEVEKALDIHGREAIEAYGLEPFSRKCVDSVFVYVREWEELTRQIGFWVDLPKAYVTFHRSYVESVWWALSRLFEKGLLYQGHKVVWWWPQGGTTLSAGEVGMGYKEVDDPAITVRFIDAEDANTAFLAWTTTPWTLPSNVALAVGEDVDYALCDDPGREGGTLILAAARAESYGLVPRTTVKGASLVGRRYVPLYDFGPVTPTPQGSGAFIVVAGQHVTTDTGAGIVHTAPAFGEDDMDVARAQGLGILQWIDPAGKFSEGPWKGRFCKEADKDIITELKERGLLFKRDQVRHQYPFCWRADSDPLIQYARPAWFIRTTAFKDTALANNQAVEWHPEHIKEGRFGDFLRNNVDWALSRERFWGTPLNIWTCEACGKREAPASYAAMKAKPNARGFAEGVDEHLAVHKPWIDTVAWDCTCGAPMKRVSEVIDCWFDSGCMPFAQWGWPHQGDAEFKASYPADFISEAVDQTRGWFYSLLMIATMLFDDDTCKEYGVAPVGLPRPYKHCIVLGHVCDMEGKKESKSKGNYTSPNLVLRGKTRLDAFPDANLARGTVGLKAAQLPSLDVGDEPVTLSFTEDGVSLKTKVVVADVKPKDAVHLHPDDLEAIGAPRDGGKIWFRTPGEPPGADAFRWLFCASNAPWSNTRLSIRAIREGQREFLIRLRNVYQFFAIYADIAKGKGHFDPSGKAPRPASQRHLLDRWIASRLNQVVANATTSMDAYDLFGATKELSGFVDDLSNWYVRRSRERFWGEGTDLEDALWTLHEVLSTFARLIAPFVPFTAEALWRELRTEAQPESVHLVAWPDADLSQVDATLVRDMALIRDLASLGLAARATAKLKVRQPLHEATLVLADPSLQSAVEGLSSLLLDELNVHRIDFAADAAKYVQFAVKPDFKKLGKRLGKDMKAVATAIGAMDPLAVKRALDAGGVDVDYAGGTARLAPDEVVVAITPIGEWQAQASTAGVLVISTVLDDALRAEGLVRELVNRVQGLRKDLDLGYSQRIALSVNGPAVVLDAVRAHQALVASETLTTELVLGANIGEAKMVDVDGNEVFLGIELR